jgi:hypothetical protein
MYWPSANRISRRIPFLEDAGFDVGVADGAEQDRVVLFISATAPAGRISFGSQVALAAPVV